MTQDDNESLDCTSVEQSEMASLACEWDGLVSDAGYPPFMRADFILEAMEILGCRGGRLFLARRKGSLMAAGILVPLGLGRWATYQPSQLPLGCWLMARDLSWQQILPLSLKTLPGLPILVSVTQQDPAIVVRPPADRRLETLDYVPTGWIDIQGSFDEFWKERGKNLRQNLSKQRRKLEDEGNALEFQFLERPADVDAAFLEFATLESAGWKSAEGTAIGIGDRQGTFYRTMLARFAATGQSFAMRLTLNGKPVAVDFGIRDAGSLVILKTTYDEKWKSVSPAQLLHQQAFELLFRQPTARRIEFYGKFMEWHSRWTQKSRMLFHLNYYRGPALRSMLGSVRRLKWRVIADQPVV